MYHLTTMTSLVAIIQQRRRRRKAEHTVLRKSIFWLQRAAATASRVGVIATTRRHVGRQWRGRIQGSRSRDRGICTWIEDYVDDVPVCPKLAFRGKFGVPIALFYNDSRRSCVASGKFLRDKDQCCKSTRSLFPRKDIVMLTGPAPWKML